MKRILAVLMTLSAVCWATGRSDANDHRRYGSVGVQFGFYRYPPPGVAGYGYAPSSGCHGYAPSYGYGYTPSYGYGYAPSGGCSGSGFSYGYSPGYGYAPQSGFFPPFGSAIAGGFAEKLAERLLDKFISGGTADAATKDEVKKLRDDVDDLKKAVKAITVPQNLDERLKKIQEQLDKQADSTEGVKKALKAKFPDLVFP